MTLMKENVSKVSRSTRTVSRRRRLTNKNEHPKATILLGLTNPNRCSHVPRHCGRRSRLLCPSFLVSPLTFFSPPPELNPNFAQQNTKQPQTQTQNVRNMAMLILLTPPAIACTIVLTTHPTPPHPHHHLYCDVV
eukprot:m.19087 g.19087  ORF g.19087 m.19087 type:complete len:135 (+) comp12328_c0_seq1:205-609(+)